ncbi:hypothetical protein P7K49_037958 [Saguinus oedipus]|uniref:Uncharacterized protein n=1 Tax=Saguinus oedipus TaxID=9490 RepID=A0ABQ9TDA0_SAGOE|nr:hypothetical protein P7K49_037958 [Saguinus oedipus]
MDVCGPSSSGLDRPLGSRVRLCTAHVPPPLRESCRRLGLPPCLCTFWTSRVIFRKLSSGAATCFPTVCAGCSVLDGCIGRSRALHVASWPSVGVGRSRRSVTEVLAGLTPSFPGAALRQRKYVGIVTSLTVRPLCPPCERVLWCVVLAAVRCLKQKELEELERERKREEKLRKREQKQRERELRRSQKRLEKLQAEEQKQLQEKIRLEERKLLLAQRNLQSIRLIAELLSRAKVPATEPPQPPAAPPLTRGWRHGAISPPATAAHKPALMPRMAAPAR